VGDRVALDQPDLEACVLESGEEGFRLVSAWSYTWEHQGLRRRLTIPAGFEHDGASIPRFLWSCLGLTPAGLISAAAVAHDALYRHSGRLPRGWLHEQMPGAAGWSDAYLTGTGFYCRQEADLLFARLMREAGVPKLRRRLAYIGVRIGGYFAWVEASA
jgi:hypothetical protein